MSQRLKYSSNSYVNLDELELERSEFQRKNNYGGYEARSELVGLWAVFKELKKDVKLIKMQNLKKMCFQVEAVRSCHSQQDGQWMKP